MSIYMQATDITGDVTTTGYLQWILLDSLQFGAQRAIHTPVGEVQRRSFGVASFSDLEITKKICSASDNLWQYICHNKSISEINIHQCINQQQPTIEIALHNVYITNHHRYLLREDLPYERITLNYVAITTTYTKQNSNGDMAIPNRTQYDLQTGN